MRTNIAAEVAQFKRDIEGWSPEEIKRFHQIEINSNGTVYDFVTETEFKNLAEWILECNEQNSDQYEDEYSTRFNDDEEF